MQPKAVALSKEMKPLIQMRGLWLGLLTTALVLAQVMMANARPESLAPLAEQISPSVVNITTSTVVERPTGPQGIVPEGSPLEDLFNNRPKGEGSPRSRRSSALGSGFVISEDGYVVTNNHVIEGADDIEVEFIINDEVQKFNAEIVQSDKVNDLAIIKIFDMNFDGVSEPPYNFKFR